MFVKILGVKKITYKGKDNQERTGFNLMGVKEFTDYEKENAECKGYDVIREFSSKDYAVEPGDVVEFLYEPGYEGRATLVGVRSVSMKDNPFEKEEKAATGGVK